MGYRLLATHIQRSRRESCKEIVIPRQIRWKKFAVRLHNHLEEAIPHHENLRARPIAMGCRNIVRGALHMYLLAVHATHIRGVSPKRF
ncbi:hypothetical protein V6N11_028302 [Hibiscus sabdariffa]|uniref:Uncharacterized protein n=2 Tax=Hibiscus sabdariffa TaxID=183260 RepID=A0ABR2C6V7_9ROSI